MRNLRLTPEAEINLYRIAQEALNNINKHARANEVQVQLIKDKEQVRLTISDDGSGFDDEKQNLSTTSIGLISVRERAQLIGGSFKIETAPGEGTTIYISMPIVAVKITEDQAERSE